ncbi:MAG TPA: DNA-binding response regulator [Pseudomonas sp.]|jgi:two-component system response regulator PfeR|nr:DNA-binding response regulator [Pseudomonas sp.]MBB52595.1 DNA-binding response regulator [Pseudomonadales bacterium]MAQ52465.1 DNA-binding response regulator [Pseudomonas sp.]MBF76486.1 DNA-binding response regulator [Pseudomonadales bacterium]HCA25889.1 DNA-binding response regulator [Pseudomonas sp.]|tara:strand:+ start:1136 stop:1828 length:693 start_codon:yes stop_codon:yes gene_type:complete
MSGPLGHILIVEDDRQLSGQLGQLLEHAGYGVQCCGDGSAGLELALREQHDLLLLDVKLPGLNGFSLLKRLRQHSRMPVIMVTASNAEEERIRGLRHGADDYLAKPYSLEELQLRIDAVLRRVRPVGARQAEPEQLAVGSLRLDRAQQWAEAGGMRLDLTPLQFRLLWQLVAQRGEVLSKPYLYRVVLDREFSRYDRSLDMHISRIRRRLIDAGLGDVLQTQHGRGYLFA